MSADGMKALVAQLAVKERPIAPFGGNGGGGGGRRAGGWKGGQAFAWVFQEPGFVSQSRVLFTSWWLEVGREPFRS